MGQIRSILLPPEERELTEEERKIFDDIPEDTKDDYRCAFSLYDRCGDLHVRCKEIEKIIWALGLQVNDWDRKEIMKECDVNGDGTVGFDKFAVALHKRNKSFSEETNEAKAVFQVFDRNGDGLITAEEILYVSKTLSDGSCPGVLTESEVRKIFGKNETLKETEFIASFSR
eukprot:NODE_8772_length_647_cov_59.360687_g8147_i0.p1 GENE.NODE_8772_length_647_cov_59.360687_g8147_i0~~NODE_8772_length_647_cov_59.360687_g8147_i0.p1  ORF type:complete len:172 (+),score=31.65 NODE_8772_length_647_cov_59.360687_g8147_i0:60-575(+)